MLSIEAIEGEELQILPLSTRWQSSLVGKFSRSPFLFTVQSNHVCHNLVEGDKCVSDTATFHQGAVGLGSSVEMFSRSPFLCMLCGVLVFRSSFFFFPSISSASIYSANSLSAH